MYTPSTSSLAPSEKPEIVDKKAPSLFLAFSVSTTLRLVCPPNVLVPSIPLARKGKTNVVEDGYPVILLWHIQAYFAEGTCFNVCGAHITKHP